VNPILSDIHVVMCLSIQSEHCVDKGWEPEMELLSEVDQDTPYTLMIAGLAPLSGKLTAYLDWAPRSQNTVSRK